MTKEDVACMTKAIRKLKITQWHKRKCKCPFCGRVVVAHKLERHQKRAECQLAQFTAGVNTYC